MRQALAASALAALLAIGLFSATGQDDSHITYWAARALATQGAIVNYSGHAVEQSSSLLHTVVLALLFRITPFSLPTLGYVVGIVAAVLAVVRAAAFASSRGRTTGFLLPLAAATAPLTCYWMLGGLETTLAAWLFVELSLAQIGVIEGRIRALGARNLLVSSAFVAVRPESFFVAASALFGFGLLWALRWRPGDRGRAVLRALGRVAMLLAIVTLAFGLLTAFRWFYFGNLFPEPVSAKIGGAPFDVTAAAGVRYLLGELLRAEVGVLVPVWIAAGIWAIFRQDDPEPTEGVVTCLAGAQLAFAACAGGDWMVGARFIAVIVPLLYLALFRLLSRAGLSRSAFSSVGLALVVLNVVGVLELAMHRAPGRPLWVQLQSDQAIRDAAGEMDFPWPDRANQTHTRDLLAIGAMLRTVDRILQHQPKVVIMSGQAGMVMYYTASHYHGRIEFIDRHGLTSRHLEPFRNELDIKKLSTGLRVSTDRYLSLAERHPDAGLVPDIVFDISPKRRNAAERHGYVCVYEQSGKMSASRPERPGPPATRKPSPVPTVPDWFTVRGDIYQFIAVRKELAGYVLDSNHEPERRQWNAGR